MKKLIILIALAFTTLGYSQAEFEKIAITENTSTAETSRIVSQQPVGGELNYINATALPVSTATTNALELETTVSAGAVSEFALTNNGNGTVNIGDGIAYLRATNDPYATIIKYPISAVTNLALTDNANNYVLVDYNGGSPTITVTTNGSTINTQTNSLAYVIARVGNDLEYLNLVGQNVDPNAKIRIRFLNQEGIRRASGAVLGFSNRNLTLTSSVLFSGLIRINAAAFNTASPDTFTLVYNNGSAWTRTAGQTQVNNTQYNVSGVLTTMPNNTFRTDYVYLLPNNPSKLYVVMGTTTYGSLTLAKAAPRPSSLPVELQVLGLEVGRLFIEKSNASIAEVQSSFANEFVGASVPEHNSLSGLQSETPGEYNHLSNAQLSSINGALHTDSTPETKIGSLTLGENLTHASDNWIALGTSVTEQGFYTTPLSKQLSIVLNNFGVSSSTTNDLPARYGDIPTLNSGNVDSYRLLSLEYGINDAITAVPINTYKTNLTNAILHAKGKGWANNKILIINSNYCTNAALDTELEPYAIAAIEVAIAEDVQYVDIYNYTKNNGGGALLSDGIHPNAAGGIVYARGVAVLMNGGVILNNLHVVNGVTTNTGASINNLTFGANGIGINTQTPSHSLTVNNTATSFDDVVMGNVFAGGYLKFSHYDLDGTNGSMRIGSYRQSGASSDMVLGSGAVEYLRLEANNPLSGQASVFKRTVQVNADASGGGTVFLMNNGTTPLMQMSNDLPLGGVLTDFSTYIFGSGKYRIWTGGVARFGISPSGAVSIYSAPSTSAGTYDILTRNTSSGEVEKISSSTFAPTISPTFTGTPTAPTATAGTNTTQIATTAFVLANSGSSSGTFTPSSTGGITFFRCYWVKNGNVLDITYNFSITGSTTYSATMTLPNGFTIDSNSNGRDIGGGKVTTNSGYSRIQETATSSDIGLGIISENTGVNYGFARASVLIN